MWKRLEGKYNYKYEVNENGEIRRYTVYCPHCHLWSKPRIIKGSIGNHGYRTVCLKLGGKFRTILLHRLIAGAFVPNHSSKKEVNHINGDKTDASASNLEWVTRSENELHSYRVLGRKGSKPHLNKKSADHHSSKGVCQYDLNGKVIKIWSSTMDVERGLGLNNASISKCCGGVYNYAGGYLWKYIAPDTKAFEILENKLPIK